MLCSMMLLLDRETLGLLVSEDPLVNPEFADYVIQGASVMVSDAAGRPDWLGIAADGSDIDPVAAPRRAVMIAEQLAKRSYQNPDSIITEGNIGPIGGDRKVEDFARAFEFTPVEQAYLDDINLRTGIVDNGGVSGVWTLGFEVRPSYGVDWATIFLPELDPRAKLIPMGTEGVDGFAYGPVS